MPTPTLDTTTARWLPWLIAVAFFMQSLDATIVNTALPRMAADLGENPLRMQGVVIAYLLTVALLIPASGWISDRFGSRRVFFTAIALFTFGSLLRTSCVASGRRRSAAALAKKSTALSTGAQRSASVPKAMAPPPRNAPTLKPTLRAEYMYARDSTRSEGGRTSMT